MSTEDGTRDDGTKMTDQERLLAARKKQAAQDAERRQSIQDRSAKPTEASPIRKVPND